MSSLWTPGGERPVERQPAQPAAEAGADMADLGGDEELTEAEMAARMAELRDQLARTPAAAVVANHAYGLFELAALHLSLDPPQLEEAQVAIDALGAIVTTLAGRLGDAEHHLQDGLAQLRLAFVQLKGAAPEG
ncbi:MAG: hypothetical protein JO367_11385 [Actinobacteria bacterium]|nr:hypothetical protein [Actinomycetota bacterium]